MTDHEDRLNRALQAALDRYAVAMDEPFPCDPILTVPVSDKFMASVAISGDTIEIKVNTGLVDAFINLWRKSIAHSETLPEEDQLNIGDIDQAVHASLTWVMLHELHHFQMGHFQIAGRMALVESGDQQTLDLVSRVEKKPCLFDTLPKEQRHLAHQCLELQADHDSTEMLLDSYSTDGWDILRFYAASIFVVMILIEREGTVAGDEIREYPKAATRIFQFIGYLSVMWSIPAYVEANRNGLDSPRDEDIPSKEEIVAFHSEVVAPAFGDAILIAKASDAQHVIDELGNAEDFVADIRASQHDQGQELRTTGAQEYDLLLPINSVVLQLLDIDPFKA